MRQPLKLLSEVAVQPVFRCIKVVRTMLITESAMWQTEPNIPAVKTADSGLNCCCRKRSTPGEPNINSVSCIAGKTIT